MFDKRTNILAGSLTQFNPSMKDLKKKDGSMKQRIVDTPETETEMKK